MTNEPKTQAGRALLDKPLHQGAEWLRLAILAIEAEAAAAPAARFVGGTMSGHWESESAQPPPPNIQWNPEPPRGVTPALDVALLDYAMDHWGVSKAKRDGIIAEYNRLAGSE